MKLPTFQAREEVRLTHFYYSEWPGGVEEGEQVGQSTHAIDTVAEHDCSTLNERDVRKVCSIRRIFVST